MNNNFTVAMSAIKLLKDGIDNENKAKILSAYEMVEHDSFSWESSDLDVAFMEWNKLIDEANEILYK